MYTSFPAICLFTSRSGEVERGEPVATPQKPSRRPKKERYLGRDTPVKMIKKQTFARCRVGNRVKLLKKRPQCIPIGLSMPLFVTICEL